jgi:hypothetical protein
MGPPFQTVPGGVLIDVTFGTKIFLFFEILLASDIELISSLESAMSPCLTSPEASRLLTTTRKYRFFNHGLSEPALVPRLALINKNSFKCSYQC